MAPYGIPYPVYQVKNQSGQVVYENSDGPTAVQWALDNLTSGRTIMETVTIDSNANMTLGPTKSRIDINDNYTKLIINATLTKASGLSSPNHMIYVDAHDVAIEGSGILDGNCDAYDWTGERDQAPSAHGIFIHKNSSGIYNVTIGSSSATLTIQNTIRSSVVIGSGRTGIDVHDVTVHYCKLKNSKADHWIYIASGYNYTIADNICEGYVAGEGFAIMYADRSQGFTYITNNTIQNIASNPKGYSLGWVFNYRNSTRYSKNVEVTENTVNAGSSYFTKLAYIQSSNDHCKFDYNTVTGSFSDSNVIILNGTNGSAQNNSISQTSGNNGILCNGSGNTVANNTGFSFTGPCP